MNKHLDQDSDIYAVAIHSFDRTDGPVLNVCYTQEKKLQLHSRKEIAATLKKRNCK